jgi:hypothetical protein
LGLGTCRTIRLADKPLYVVFNFSLRLTAGDNEGVK